MQLVIILVIVLLLFGTKRLKGLGGDLGGAIKGFKKAMSEDEQDKDDAKEAPKKVAAEDAQTVEPAAAKSEAKKD